MTRALGLALFLTGCGAATPDGGQTDAAAGSTASDAESNPYGVPYPSISVGYNARRGSIRGDQIANYAFQGYPNGDTSKGLQTIMLADFYDPQGKLGFKLLHLGVAGLWCGPCNLETRETVPLIPTFAKEGVVFAQALDQGAAVGAAATVTDLDNWIAKYRSNFTEMLDPNDANLGPFYDSASIPWNAVIDTRTMEILSDGTGYSGDLEADVAPWLDWVAANPPSYPVR